ncbi:hypothetical protein [Pseudomonas sp. LP_7_YM]|uniref:hypothetical protein n=1 Tax=Pseudomonas sp. LP_7_YM TaxID=2485137 RepID=UPI00105F974D|nr:hypothetical protein [Pseudomonas sp. LP_7_YM]TDV58516.1 hypothetical protein EC915_1392 [Pseudomonas sp. LP_7_YM]
MISKKVVDYCKQNGWWYDDASADYEVELKKIGMDISSDISQFYLHAEDGPTFMRGGKEIYQLCWFLKNTNFDLALKRTHETLEMPLDYIPLDSFEGEHGYFYNKTSGEVIELSLGDSMGNFKSGKLSPQWSCFSDFLESFFEMG